jgi:hypothetical protein
VTTIEVDESDPHNDQLLAQTADDLMNHMETVRSVVEQGEEQNAPLASIVAALATAWIDTPSMTRERMASVLALALIKNHAHILDAEYEELEAFILRVKEPE